MEGIPKYIFIGVSTCNRMFIAKVTHFECSRGTTRPPCHLESCRSTNKNTFKRQIVLVEKQKFAGNSISSTLTCLSEALNKIDIYIYIYIYRERERERCIFMDP
jgi:hypothetical protein